MQNGEDEIFVAVVMVRRAGGGYAVPDANQLTKSILSALEPEMQPSQGHSVQPRVRLERVGPRPEASKLSPEVGPLTATGGVVPYDRAPDAVRGRRPWPGWIYAVAGLISFVTAIYLCQYIWP